MTAETARGPFNGRIASPQIAALGRHVPALVLVVADMSRMKSSKIRELAARDVVHQRAVKNTGSLDCFGDLPWWFLWRAS